MNIIRYRVRIFLLLVLLTLMTGISTAQGRTSCKPSDVNQQIDIAIADYQQTRHTDDLISALEDFYSLIRSSIGVFSECIPGLEDLSESSTESDIDGVDESPDAIRAEGGAGTFADPIKEGWTISDGEGRWIQPVAYVRAGNQICTTSLNGSCEDADPGNEFVGVIIYGKCDDSHRTRCNFNRYGEFELAGERGIPYKVWSSWRIDEVYEIFPDDILPGGEASGIVFFQARGNELEFKFGWTPDYSSDTIWFGPLIDSSDLSQTTTTPDITPDHAFSQSNSLNIRSGPGTNYERVGSLNFGESVPVLGRNSSGTWIQTDKGWVFAQYLSWPPATDFMTLPVTSN